MALHVNPSSFFYILCVAFQKYSAAVVIFRICKNRFSYTADTNFHTLLSNVQKNYSVLIEHTQNSGSDPV